MNVTVWNENVVENRDPLVRALHPEGIHGTLASFLRSEPDLHVTEATLDMPECGLPDSVLNETDVMLWWGHAAHDRVPDELAEKVADRVLAGMGFVALHSAHDSKVFRRLMGTSCSLRWRLGDFERLWCIEPGHPISRDLPAVFSLEEEEMYGETFDVPTPEHVVYAGWFRGGELFRSVCTWTRGAGHVVYLQPGHETCRAFYNPNVRRLIVNAVRWSCPVRFRGTLDCLQMPDTTEAMERGWQDYGALYY